MSGKTLPRYFPNYVQRVGREVHILAGAVPGYELIFLKNCPSACCAVSAYSEMLVATLLDSAHCRL